MSPSILPRTHSLSTGPTHSPIPVTLLTGFPGSGKTTVLNHLVRQPALADTLVILDASGTASLDHPLVVHSSEAPGTTPGVGCLCCSRRSDLPQTLRDVGWRFSRNGQRQFGRVLIEIPALADPAPVALVLAGHPQIASRYRLDGIVACVDLTQAAGTLDRHPEAGRQVAMANVLLLTRPDLATPAQQAAVHERLDRLNPAATRHVAEHGVIAPERVLGTVRADAGT